MAENHIIVGLGGTGGKVLRTFKMRMFEEFPKFEERQKQSVALLYVDTTMEMMGIGRDDFNVMGQDASFTQNEFLFIKSSAVTEIIDNVENYPQLRGIVGNAAATRNAIGNLGEAAGQSVFHCHMHLIPRYKGDVSNQKGGVRGVIPSKQKY